MKRTPHERRAQCRHHRDREQRRTDHRKCLGEGERVEKLPLASGEREHWHERKDDDHHREKNRAADLPRGRQHRFPCLGGGEARRDAGASQRRSVAALTPVLRVSFHRSISPRLHHSVSFSLFRPFAMPDHVFGHHDAGVHEHADGDGDARQRHDIRREAELVHEYERNQD